MHRIINTSIHLTPKSDKKMNIGPGMVINVSELIPLVDAGLITIKAGSIVFPSLSRHKHSSQYTLKVDDFPEHTVEEWSIAAKDCSTWQPNMAWLWVSVASFDFNGFFVYLSNITHSDENSGINRIKDIMEHS